MEQKTICKIPKGYKYCEYSGPMLSCCWKCGISMAKKEVME